VQPLPMQSEVAIKVQNDTSSAAEPNPFFCDDPKSG
jgi:hypothetical protein